MGFQEGGSADGALSGRGSQVNRGFALGIMTTLGGLGRAMPNLIPDFRTATFTAIAVVFFSALADRLNPEPPNGHTVSAGNLSGRSGRRTALFGRRS
jgi:hypothetical protein